jgi:hypothetical protein
MVMPMRSSPSSSPCPSSGRRTRPSPVPQAMTLTEESLSETGGAPRAETSVTDTTARPSGRFFGRRTGPGAPGQDRGCASLRMTPFAGLFLRICYNSAPRRVPRPWPAPGFAARLHAPAVGAAAAVRCARGSFQRLAVGALLLGGLSLGCAGGVAAAVMAS